MRNYLLFLAAMFATSSLPAGATSSVQPNPDIAASFATVKVQPTGLSVLKNSDLTYDHAKIILQKSALEKEFLLHAEMLVQTTAPRFSGLKSRVVAFRLRGNSLFMLEATPGHTVTHELPQNLILAEFPVIQQDAKTIEFDFNAGMSEVFSVAEWRASDTEGPTYKADAEFSSSNIKHSYIDDVSLSTSRNELTIIQHAQVFGAPLDMQVANVAVEIRYYLSPYILNSKFKPVLTADFKHMGFFEVAPQLANDGVKVYATHFDPAYNRPITYAISPNTPKAFHDAIREGILYWNRAFGYEKVKVVDAPAGVSAPSPDYNVVQWVNYDSAGAAYADAQMDPRTGETRHAQVYMTSAFAFVSRLRLRQLMRQLSGQQTPRKTLSVAGMPLSLLCDREDSARLSEMLSEISASNISDDQILEISRDYIRVVVAHEVGHTLGLRHNFAGNLGGNLDISNLDAVFENYAKTLLIPDDLRTTSSVMEYQNFQSSLLTGRMIAKTNGPVMDYDNKAIAVLYRAAEYKPSELPLYCSDALQGSILGCSVWDQGPSPLANVMYNVQHSINNLPRALIELIIQAKTPPFSARPQDVGSLELNAETAAQGLMSAKSLILDALTTGQQDLRVLRSFSKVDSLNSDLIKQKTLAASAAEITRLGGLKTLLTLPPDSQVETWTLEFNKLIDDSAYNIGIGYNGQPYVFTPDEISAAKEIAKIYFAKVQKALYLADTKLLTAKNGALANTPVADEFADILMAREIEYLFAETGASLKDRLTFGDNKSAVVTLPVFKYSQDVRLAAANLLIGRSTEAEDWGLAQHDSVKKSFKDKMKLLLLDNDIQTVHPELNSREVSRWILQNKAILLSLQNRD